MVFEEGTTSCVILRLLGYSDIVYEEEVELKIVVDVMETGDVVG